MKKIVVIIISVTVVYSCGGNRSNRAFSTASTVSMAETAPDSILFIRHWNNPEHYVFDKPSDEKIKEWQDACEELNATYDSLYIPAYMDSLMASHLAYRDWFEVCCSMEGLRRGYDEDCDFLLWRMNEMLPPTKEFKGEVERYAFFRRQADSLGNCWNAGTQWDYNFISILHCRIAIAEGKTYEALLHRELSSISNLLEKEDAAYDSFRRSVGETFEKTQLSPDCRRGSAAPMADAEIWEEVAVHRNRSIVPFYLALTDSENVQEPERHAEVTDKMISDEYDLFISSLEQRDYGYPLEEQKASLKAERRAWNRWMDMRERVSGCLSGASRESWDNCTNNLKRSRLKSLKNRYSGYGIFRVNKKDF